MQFKIDAVKGVEGTDDVGNRLGLMPVVVQPQLSSSVVEKAQFYCIIFSNVGQYLLQRGVLVVEGGGCGLR